jgi:hypothetical protein
MSKTAAYVRYAVVPSFPRLPLEHPGLSTANRHPFSRDFFNSIDPEPPLANGRNWAVKNRHERVSTATQFGIFTISIFANIPTDEY